MTRSHTPTAVATLSSTSTSPVRHSSKALRNSSEEAISSYSSKVTTGLPTEAMASCSQLARGGEEGTRARVHALIGEHTPSSIPSR